MCSAERCASNWAENELAVTPHSLTFSARSWPASDKSRRTEMSTAIESSHPALQGWASIASRSIASAATSKVQCGRRQSLSASWPRSSWLESFPDSARCTLRWLMSSTTLPPATNGISAASAGWLALAVMSMASNSRRGPASRSNTTGLLSCARCCAPAPRIDTCTFAVAPRNLRPEPSKPGTCSAAVSVWSGCATLKSMLSWLP